MKLRDKLYRLRFNFGDFKQGETLQVTDLVFSNKRFNAIVKIGKTKTKIPWSYIKELDSIERYMFSKDNVDWFKSINNRHYFRIKSNGVMLYQDYIRK